MKFENTKVYNFEGALRGMRNPKNSWNLSDSYFNIVDDYDEGILDVTDAWIQQNNSNIDIFSDEYRILEDKYCEWLYKNGIIKESLNNESYEVAYIGPKDMRLAQLLIRSGPEHRKFLRQIMVCVDITAPMYWWSEFDTYKVGTVANSTSKMHKLADYPITKECFEIGDYEGFLKLYDEEPYNIDSTVNDAWDNIINICETLR